jgi:p38 MAP kinase
MSSRPSLPRTCVFSRDSIECANSQTLRFVQSLPKREKVPFQTKFPNADPLALDLLEKMLVFDPRTRISAPEALSHEYLAPYHDPTDEPAAAEVFDWSFNDADLPVDTWKVMMYSEILGTSLTYCIGWS